MAITRLGGANAISGTIPAANVATLTFSNFPTDSVIQTKHYFISNSDTSTTSTSFVDIGSAFNFTPLSTNSILIVNISTDLKHDDGSGQNMNASASGLTGAMSAGNHAVQFVTRNGGGQCSYNEAVNGAGIVLHTYEYVA